MDSLQFSLIYLICAGLLGMVTGVIAQKKGHSFFVWWLFGTILFIVALILILVIPAQAAGSGGRNNPTKGCPYCGATLNTSAMKCTACGRSQPVLATTTVNAWEKTVGTDDQVAQWAKQQEDKKEP